MSGSYVTHVGDVYLTWKNKLKCLFSNGISTITANFSTLGVVTENTFLLLVLKKFDLHFEGTSSNSINQQSGSPEPNFSLCIRVLVYFNGIPMVRLNLTSHLLTQTATFTMGWIRD